MRATLLRTLSCLAAGAVLLGSSGCFNPFRPLLSNEQAIAEPAPSPTSPTNLMRLFQWCWQHRDNIKYREVLAADYVFEFSATDSSGAPYRGDQWILQNERNFADHLFVAGVTVGSEVKEYPAATITLIFSSLVVDHDLRPGKTFPWHQAITTFTNLTIVKTNGEALNVVGNVKFYVVRGDSAIIPPDLGFGPDSHRWYIERQVDLSTTSPLAWLQPAGPEPLRVRTWKVAPGTSAASPSGLQGPTQEIGWGGLRAMYTTPPAGTPTAARR